ncbi:MAG: hypothetical protein KF832_32070 [Caldilineaceae bacterium]|nr:hypothetical protein [Caldilineaceae bacterium]
MTESSHPTLGTSPQPAPWYVVRTKPRRELLVMSLLDGFAEIELFLPEVWQTSAKGRQLIPLFPSYLFVQVALTSSAAGALVHMPGVLGLVGHERLPTPVAATVVEALQSRVATINEQGGLRPHPFHPGDPVLVKAGPLQGLEAVFTGPLEPAQRVQILLHFLGRQQTLTVDAGVLEKSSPRPETQPAPRPRRTRGKGRRIHEAYS